MSILLAGVSFIDLTPEHERRLRDTATEHEVVVTREPETIAKVAAEVEILVGDSGVERLARFPRLRWIQLWSTGADYLYLHHPELASNTALAVTCMRGHHSRPIGEHVFALLLAWTRRLTETIPAQTDRTWVDHRSFAVPLGEISGQTMVILGTGTVGQRVARIARSFDMHTVGVRRHANWPAPGFDVTYGVENLRDALRGADFVVVALPLTPETKGLVGLMELRAMPQTAFLINVGRGAVMDEGALLTALRARWIAGAALDAFETEPLPANSPYWSLPNVIVSPHYAGDSPLNQERGLDLFAENYARYLAGTPLKNLVDRTTGY